MPQGSNRCKQTACLTDTTFHSVSNIGDTALPYHVYYQLHFVFASLYLQNIQHARQFSKAKRSQTSAFSGKHVSFKNKT